MNKPIIYALDFDGVICDSAIETGISAWKAAFQLWNDFETAYPSLLEIDKFRRVRPIMGTGYEGILIVRLIYDGESVESIIKNFHIMKHELITKYNLEIDELKKLFGEIRDTWITENLSGWIEKNPLFPGIIDKLQHLSDKNSWYIVTTKQERFVKQIFSANKIQIPDEMIFGLDRNKTKEAILIDLIKKHPDVTIYFVEDMLSALLKVKNNSQLASVKLFLAPWGYNTEQHKMDAKSQAIELIDFNDFLEA